MPVFELLCLANSKKHGGRCVAGLRTDGGGWLRPVAPTEDGTLRPCHYTLSDGSEARLLDVIRVEVSQQVSRPHQPENWAITGRRWELVARPAPLESLSLLRAHLESGSVLFGSLEPKVPFEGLLRTPARASLALVAPADLAWRIGVTAAGEKKVRCRFKLGVAQYELPLTDPAPLDELMRLQPSIYPAWTAGLPPDSRPLLAISLGEPFEGYCYKLAAAVIALPTSWWNEQLSRPAPPSQATAAPSAPVHPTRDPLLSEFAAQRGGLGARLVEAFESSSAAGETDDEAVLRLRDVLERAFREGLDETACP